MFAPGKTIRDGTIAAAAFCTVGGFLLIFLVLRSFVIEPISVLKNAAAKVAALRHIKEIAVHSKDELGSLARGLENMADSIQTYQVEQKNWQHQLEEKIAERTATLRENERFLHTVLESIQDGI